MNTVEQIESQAKYIALLEVFLETLSQLAYMRGLRVPDGQTLSEFLDAELARLAALSDENYKRERPLAAMRLAIRVDTLDAEVEKFRERKCMTDLFGEKPEEFFGLKSQVHIWGIDEAKPLP